MAIILSTWYPSLPDALAARIEQQHRLGIKARLDRLSRLDGATVVDAHGDYLALAEAGVGIGLAAEMLDDVDGERELRGAGFGEMLRPDTELHRRSLGYAAGGDGDAEDLP